MWSNRDDWRKYHRERMKLLYDRWRAVGLCGLCGREADGYAICFRHRKRRAPHPRKYHRRIKR